MGSKLFEDKDIKDFLQRKNERDINHHDTFETIFCKECLNKTVWKITKRCINCFKKYCSCCFIQTITRNILINKICLFCFYDNFNNQDIILLSQDIKAYKNKHKEIKTNYSSTIEEGNFSYLRTCNEEMICNDHLNYSQLQINEDIKQPLKRNNIFKIIKEEASVNNFSNPNNIEKIKDFPFKYYLNNTPTFNNIFYQQFYWMKKINQKSLIANIQATSDFNKLYHNFLLFESILNKKQKCKEIITTNLQNKINSFYD